METEFQRFLRKMHEDFEKARADLIRQADAALADIRKQAQAFLQGANPGNAFSIPPASSPPQLEVVPQAEVTPTPELETLEIMEMDPLLRSVSNARKCIGQPYKYGGGNAYGPTVGIVKGEQTPGFDCSGLVHHAYSMAGFILPRTTGDLMKAAKEVTAPFPGVLAFTNFDVNGVPGHVSIMIGEDRCIEAGDPVGEYNFGKDRGEIKYGVPR